MATYDKIFRQVVLRANQLAADDSSSLSLSYVTAAIGQTQMDDRAIEFPKEAVDDAILNAGDRMVSLIGLDKYSPYRTFFHDVTSNIATGSAIPIVGAAGDPRIGVIGDVRDSSTNQKLLSRSYEDVIGYASLNVKSTPFWYYTDNVRIWHTRSNVVADIVTWNKDDQLTLMAATPTRGTCPFPEDLHEALVCGALSYLFRSSFNDGQVAIWRRYFDGVLARLEGRDMLSEAVERKIVE